MNENHDPNASQPDSTHTRPSYWPRGRWTLLLGVLVFGLLTIGLGWMLLKEPPRPPALLAGDRQRLEALLAAHDYEAFLRLMELQPPEVRAELPAEWLRRYDEIKPALKFTVREASTEEVINSEVKYEAPLLSLRWSDDGKYLVDVLAKSNRKVFDGGTGRLVFVSEPTLRAETEDHWPLGKWNKPKLVNDQVLNRLCFSFGHDPNYWQRQKQCPVLLMPNPNDRSTLTGFAVDPVDVEYWLGAPKDATGEPIWTFREGWEEKVAASRRCFNVWKPDAFPR